MEARAVWRDVARRLRPFVARRVRVDADVDDVMQEVLLRMYRALPALRDEERLGPWAYRIARNVLADHYRTQARHPLAREEPEELAAPEAEDECEAEAALLGCLAPFVAALPSPYREAITATELHGLGQREAGDMQGVSLSGMKSRVQRGRARLGEMLRACCEIGVDARGRVISCEPRAGEAPRAECCMPYPREPCELGRRLREDSDHGPRRAARPGQGQPDG